MQKQIQQLEEENEILSCVGRTETPLPSRLTLSSARMSTDLRTPFQLRRDPSGISDESVSDSSQTELKQLVEEREDIEKQILQRKIEQKYLKKRLEELNHKDSGLMRSKTCVIQ